MRLERLQDESEEMGMVLHPDKTQLLCISLRQWEAMLAATYNMGKKGSKARPICGF